MKEFLVEYKTAQLKELAQNFHNTHELLLIPYRELLIKSLSLAEYLSFVSIIKSVTNKYKIYYIRKQIHDHLFSQFILPSIPANEYITNFFPEEKFFFSEQFKDLRYTDIICFIIPKNKKISLISLKNEIEEINRKFNLECFNFKDEQLYKQYSNFFCHLFGIYEIAIDKEKIEKTQELIKTYNAPAKNINFDIKDTYKAKDFCKTISEIIDNFTLKDKSNFTYGASRDYKILREEYFIIMLYLEKILKNDDAEVILGKKTKRWDAQINGETIEVTIAVDKNEHLVRKMLSANYPLPLSYLTNDQIAKDTILLTILESIKKKMEKNYGDNRILIVSTQREFFEYFEICHDFFGFNTLTTAINYLQTNLKSQSIFSKIYLFLDEKPFQLFPSK